MKKKLSLLLALLMLASSMAACAESEENTGSAADTTTVSDTSAPSAGEEIAAEEEEGESFDPELGEKDFDGKTFTIATTSVASFNEWGEGSIWVEGYTGEVLNDAVYDRNAYIAETYNAVIAAQECDNGALVSAIQNAVTAGDTTYDAAMPPLDQAGTLVKNGCLVDLATEATHMNLERAWWDERSIADLSIANKVFMVSGDISTLNNDATWCTMLNLQVLQDHGFETPYHYVTNNQWTLDTYKTLCTGTSIDLDGDGDLDSKDSVANLTQNENATAMVITSGYHLIDKDENDIPVFNLEGNERLYDVLKDLSTFMNDTNVSLNYHNYASEGYHLLTTKMFEENRGLGWITNLQLVIRLREMETDFCLVPCPKYDETQENYRNVVWFVGSYTTIPISAGNVEDSSFILEAMAAKSREILRPAYYEVALSMKYLRDKESIEMLDLVIDNRSYELEHAFSFGASNAVSTIVLNGKDPASTFATQKKAINKMIEKTIEKLIEG